MKEKKRSSYEMRYINLNDEDDRLDQKREKGSRADRKGRDRQKDRSDRRQEKQEQRRKKVTNKEFARVTYLFVGLFLCLMGYIVYFNVVKSKDVINNPYNQRQDLFADRVIRGSILDSEGHVLAKTEVGEGGTERRVYPKGDMYAHVVGYAAKGKSGLELTENFNLLTSNAFFVEKIMREFKEEKNIGDNVVTTLNGNLQKAAYDALGSRKGAVVVMEPSTGKILAMVSKPAYNPNTIKEDWTALNENTEGILVNRATQGKYPPGSTFKLVTTLAYMRQFSDYENYTFHCDSEYTYEGATIHCAGNKKHGDEDLKSSVANSCNASFSNMALQIDKSMFNKTAKELMFNVKLPSKLPASQSRFELTKSDPASEVMMTGIGQGKTQVSPYHMAMIVCGIANGGKVMEPYLVDQIVNYSGTTVKKYMPSSYKTIMTSNEAAKLTTYMQAVVEQGTASALNGRGYTVAGKTGTAEYSSDKSKAHSWFVGFSNVENPDIVVSVVIEGADDTGARAVNIAKQVFDAYY